MKIGCCARPEEISLVKEAGFDYVELAGKTLASMEESRFKALESECLLPSADSYGGTSLPPGNKSGLPPKAGIPCKRLRDPVRVRWFPNVEDPSGGV